MKRILPLTLLPTAALAHPGDHGPFSTTAMLWHLVSEPDHIALAVAAVAVAAVMIYRTWARK